MPSESLHKFKFTTASYEYASKHKINVKDWGVKKELLILVVAKSLKPSKVTFLLNKPNNPILIRQGRVFNDIIEKGDKQLYHFWSKKDMQKAELNIMLNYGSIEIRDTNENNDDNLDKIDEKDYKNI